MRRTSKSLDPAFEPFDFSTADSMVVKNAEDGGGGVASGFSSGGAVMRTDPYDERASCRLACLVTSRETSSFEGLVLDTTCLENASNDHRTNVGAPELIRKHLIEGAIGGLVSDLEPFRSRGRHREGDFVEVGAVVEKRDVLVVGAETNIIIVPLKLADEVGVDGGKSAVRGNAVYREESGRVAQGWGQRRRRNICGDRVLMTVQHKATDN